MTCAGAAILICADGALAKAMTCPPAQACHIEDDLSVGCGLSAEGARPLGIAGSPCGADGRRVCAADDALVLTCVDGIWVESIRCAPSTCRTHDAEFAACANGGYTLGDRCDFDAGRSVCAVDLSAILDCAGGVTAIAEDCAAFGRRCSEVRCGDDACLSCE